jgi:cytoskeletal protein RodZ
MMVMMVMTIGGELRQAREEADVTLESVAARTKIRLRFLQAIDADEFDRLPGGIVRRGHLRAYAQAVGLDPEQIVARYLSEQESLRPIEVVALPSPPRLQLEPHYTQVRPLMQAIEAACHRSVRALQRLLLRALHSTSLPQ